MLPTRSTTLSMRGKRCSRHEWLWLLEDLNEHISADSFTEPEIEFWAVDGLSRSSRVVPAKSGGFNWSLGNYVAKLESFGRIVSELPTIPPRNTNQSLRDGRIALSTTTECPAGISGEPVGKHKPNKAKKSSDANTAQAAGIPAIALF